MYADLVALAMLIALTIYVLTGGADFGGGLWDLLASGPRAKLQRQEIARALGPIWEAHHVWLILALVLLFVAFPSTFATVSTALHLPLTLFLIGIVLRGTSFVFRSYGIQGDRASQAWGRVFAVASSGTPLLLGICVGAIASGRIQVPVTSLTASWMHPFAWILGLFLLALVAQLSAVYLAVGTADTDLREDFRRRGLAAGVLVGPLALAALTRAAADAPTLYVELATARGRLFPIVTGLVWFLGLTALIRRRLRLARLLVILQVTLVINGWAVAQSPWLLPGVETIREAAAPDSVLRMLVTALIAGLLLVGPAFVYLYSVVGVLDPHAGRRGSRPDDG